MFKDIGNKIKTLAEVICWLGIAASVLVGLVFKSMDFSLFIIIGGCFISWVSSFGLYGFGELIDQTTQTRKDIDEMKFYLKKISSSICGPSEVDSPDDAPDPATPPSASKTINTFLGSFMPYEDNNKKK